VAYASASDVSILSPHFMSGSTASSFTTSTSPTLNSVESWLSSGCAIINAKLASKGYDAIGTSSGAYEFARQANALYGAWMAEMSLLSSRVSKAENTRAQIFKDDFNDMVEMLIGLDLSQMGVTRGKAPPGNYSGGISADDKRTTEDDSDRIEPRFGRGMFSNSEAQAPDVERADEQTRSDN